MLSYHKKSIKLVNSFYWSLYTSLKNKKMGISGHLFEKYTCRDFLLNVINFRCTNFTMETLSACLWHKHFHKCHRYLYYKHPFLFLHWQNNSYHKAEFLKLTWESAMSWFSYDQWLEMLCGQNMVLKICWHFIEPGINFLSLKQCQCFPSLYHGNNYLFLFSQKQVFK